MSISEVLIGNKRHRQGTRAWRVPWRHNRIDTFSNLIKDVYVTPLEGSMDLSCYFKLPHNPISGTCLVKLQRKINKICTVGHTIDPVVKSLQVGYHFNHFNGQSNIAVSRVSGDFCWGFKNEKLTEILQNCLSKTLSIDWVLFAHDHSWLVILELLYLLKQTPAQSSLTKC